jgi:hypothetical protein
MKKCQICGAQLGFRAGKGYHVMDDGSFLCYSCYDKETQKLKDKEIKIECPFCHNEFHPYQKTPTTTGGNIVRGVVFLPWGVVSAVKNKPFVECPHCHMKIPQG